MSSKEFETAWEESKKLAQTPPDTERLELYALGKIAKKDDIEKAEPISFYQLAEKAKREKWQELLDSGLDAETAEKKYIELVEAFKEKYGLKPSEN